ncbi:MAG TPA: hypothetical protein PLH94_10335 [Fimbriimonadaceae bacterium]|nr:hypothetical protein [Fimbriimonadaceae bacterium]
MNIPKPDLSTAVPLKPIWVPGIGAFVLLDYSTGYDPSHLEQSVVFVPSTWESMWELLRAPGTFMNMVMRSYTQVWGYDAATQQVNKAVSSWPFAEPITIHIEPLTAPSPSNLATLEGLSFLYPQFKGLLDAPATYGSVKDALTGFRRNVIAAAQVPATALVGAVEANASLIKKLSARQPGKGTSGGAVPQFTTHPSGAVLPPPIPSFPLHYVAEYALDTRVLTIRYVPRYVTYPTAADKLGRRMESTQITPLTINPIQYMNFTFLHFDIAFSQPRTPESVAEARANFAMDFIENPLSLNPITGDVAAGGSSNYTLMNDQLTATGNVLSQKVGGPANRPSFTWPAHTDPSLILDSVLADPSHASGGSSGSGGNIQALGGDPSPSPCVIVVWIDGVPYYIVIKNYN